MGCKDFWSLKSNDSIKLVQYCLRRSSCRTKLDVVVLVTVLVLAIQTINWQAIGTSAWRGSGQGARLAVGQGTGISVERAAGWGSGQAAGLVDGRAFGRALGKIQEISRANFTLVIAFQNINWYGG